MCPVRSPDGNSEVTHPQLISTFAVDRGCHCTNTAYGVIPGPVIGLSAPNTALRQGDGDR
jgi:hypothetical protein